jgi:hypothetical protein
MDMSILSSILTGALGHGHGLSLGWSVPVAVAGFVFRLARRGR